MEPEEVLKLFDSFWFGHGIFKQLKHNLQESDQESKISCGSLPNNLQLRSLSAPSVGDYIKETASSRSILIRPTLQKILSGKELSEVTKEEEAEKMKKREKKLKGMKRSLSALEIEEVKGFMDLGFVFDEEDRSSGLVSIIPGLQKWGKADDCDETAYKLEAGEEVKRPYLSEAWGVLEKGKGYRNRSLLMNWRITSLENEISLKDKLRVWAHCVALSLG